MKRKLKKKFVVFLSLYIMFFVSYFTLTTLSRYTSLLNIDGNVSVAKWDVSIAGEDNKTFSTIIIGDSETYANYDLSVTSKSETAINYSVIISQVPAGVQVKVDDNSTLYDADETGTITIENLGYFKAEDENSTHNHKITILAQTGTAPFSEKELTIDVIFTQVY